MGSRKKPIPKRTILLPLFILFFLIALITVVVLEYIDFKKGKDSFIFDNIIKPTVSDKGKLDIDLLNKKLIDLFRQNGIHFDYFLDKSGKYHFKLDVNKTEVESLVIDIKKLFSGMQFSLELSEMRQQPQKSIRLYHVKKNQTTSHIILISSQIRQDETKKKKQELFPPRIAFIIDDVGNRPGISLDLKKMNIPITASILPESSYAYDEARQIFQYGLEAMIHVPMQPKNSKNNLYRSMTVIQPDSDVDTMRKVIAKAKQVIPHARGVNNHEGSLITSQEVVISKFLKVVKQEKLFFVDSRTTPDTVAYNVARDLQIKAAFRDVFLDSEKTYLHSMEQIKKLISIALKKGKAIAIGHPFQTTFQAIKDSLQSIRSHGIRIVFVSQILE